MTASMAATLVAIALSAPVVLASGYLAFLAAFSFARRKTALPSVPSCRFRILIPAHDEEAGIARTVQNLLAVDYPAEQRRLWVIADNCTDGTAAAATAAGAEVMPSRLPPVPWPRPRPPAAEAPRAARLPRA